MRTGSGGDNSSEEGGGLLSSGGDEEEGSIGDTRRKDIGHRLGMAFDRLNGVNAAAQEAALDACEHSVAEAGAAAEEEVVSGGADPVVAVIAGERASTNRALEVVANAATGKHSVLVQLLQEVRELLRQVNACIIRQPRDRLRRFHTTELVEVISSAISTIDEQDQDYLSDFDFVAIAVTEPGSGRVTHEVAVVEEMLVPPARGKQKLVNTSLLSINNNKGKLRVRLLRPTTGG